jgi:hypothetical protein
MPDPEHTGPSLESLLAVADALAVDRSFDDLTRQRRDALAELSEPEDEAPDTDRARV